MHKLLRHPAAPGRLYQQNHVGTYRSDDHGDSWRRIDKGLPSDFGFGLALDATNPDTCYTVPMEPQGGMFRATTGALRVYRWGGKGHGWASRSRGLPSDGAYLSVLREGVASDGLPRCGLYVGTGGGQVFHGSDGGRRWTALASYLPPVLSVSAAVV
ncbi:MAG: hypothetical protein L0216_13070 [Planctomycetales bacterium]|nr:hypothetical protein [Planctomycetales bacterium]